MTPCREYFASENPGAYSVNLGHLRFSKKLLAQEGHTTQPLLPRARPRDHIVRCGADVLRSHMRGQAACEKKTPLSRSQKNLDPYHLGAT